MLPDMADSFPHNRSPEMMSSNDTALIVVDVQEKLMPLVPGGSRIVWNIGRLLDAAEILGVGCFGTEQYPKGLGATVDPLRSRLAEMHEKLAFSAAACRSLVEQLEGREIIRVLLVGIETHVCVQQTALDLLAAGFRVYVAADAVGSRFAHDYEFASRRMETSGVVLTTTEAAMFEWCEVAGTPEFKKVSGLVRQPPPE